MSIMNNDEIGTYILAQADWIDVEASPEYPLTPMGREDEPPSWRGGSETLRFDEEGDRHTKFYAFAICENKNVFDADGGQERLQAQEASMRENVDEMPKRTVQRRPGRC